MGGLLQDMGQYIIAQGICVGDGQDLFRDFSPPSPDDAVILTEYTGASAPVDLVCNRSVQITVRCTDYEQGKEKASRLYKLFEVPENRILNFTADRWAVVAARQPPVKIGKDENGRILIVFNLSVVTYPD